MSDEHQSETATPPEPSRAAKPPLDDDEALARMLAARGVPAEEIARLLMKPGQGAVSPAAGAPQQPEVTMVLSPQQFEPHPTISFPEFRDPAPNDAEEAERLLRDAHLARRRGRFQAAFDACFAAIERVPRDAVALEMLGDILQSLGRVDDAIAAYHRAGEADPDRRSAERKYAQLVLMQDRTATAVVQRPEPKNPYLAVLLSALCPGAGQYYNGETVKALIFACTALALLVALLWTPLGFAGTEPGISPTSAMLMAGLGILYVVGLADANIGARHPRTTRSGWDV
jgi:tetratricopeptide (TPR) repeat protein